MSARSETRAAVLAKALGAAALLGASSLIIGRKGRRLEDGHPPAARERPTDDDLHSRHVDLITYVIGYALALTLTCLAFGFVYWHWFAAQTALGLVLGLALVQALVHFRCFLHINLKRSARDDRQLILFSTLIVLLMVGGTLVVLFNLRMRMM
ncbi:cytochrome o ubiquinol oxidase subunit IV [Methylobacterium phyllostachyos]|uniref:Cytochrome bo(3) ubiquinol oxidase subunit 4 n=1 Tax=Methylobacterium phyllostachyos TaxID=582672 RepID=A0A1G9S271_9HYPH|nr:cytochrome C oxidase subunit IV family protein [Methylobacterium phyllostachyos]SDM29367.1 cytochrome o ubiquinol oxidase subunit IV [Methylobacterium phyllostachyos]